MKRTKYIILAGTALTLAACSAADDPIQPLDTPVAAVIVGGIGDARSRAANTSWDSDDQIGISTTSAGNTVYTNMQYRTSGNGDFTYAGDATGIFFQDKEDVIFSAYYPFSGTEGTSAEIIRNVSTTDQTNQKQFDYLLATRDTIRGTSTVNLLFTHKMTRIVLNISVDSSSGLASSDMQNGTYYLSGIKLTGDFDTEIGIATTSGDTTNNWRINATPTDNGDVRSYSLIVFPQSIPKLTFRADINKKTYSGVFKNLSLTAGTSCAFNISIRKTGLVFGSCTITNRTEGGSDSSTVTVDPFNGHKAVLMREASAYHPPLYLATCNIGANTPEEYGRYFWWGDIVGYLPGSTTGFDFSESNTKIDTHKKSIEDLRRDGIIDDKNNLTPNRDAARQLWSGSWRMPTREDMEWLMNHPNPDPISNPNPNCTWRPSTNPAGYHVRSQSTGNEIFLPTAGRYEGTDDDYIDTFGCYWLSTADGDSSVSGWALFFSFLSRPLPFSPWAGLSVRPVSNYSGDVFKKEGAQLPAMNYPPMN